MAALRVSVVLLSTICAAGCTDRPGPRVAKAQQGESQAPTPTALWAVHQVDVLLADRPDTLAHLATQLNALAIIEGGDWDAALPMDLRPEELDSIWTRVREKYDTAWVRGYMVTNTRAGFVHTLACLYVRSKVPTLFDQVPGAFGADGERWPEWIEEHKALFSGS